MREHHTKTCPRCKLPLPLSSFAKNRNRKSGLQTYCKPCSVILVVESRDRRRDKPQKIKKFTSSRINLLTAHGSPTDNLYINLRCRCSSCRSAHDENNRAYCAANQEKVVAYRVAYWLSHKEELLAKRETERDQQRAYGKGHYKKNRSRLLKEKAAYRAANKGKVAKNNAAWRAANQDKIAVLNWNRYARKQNAPGSYSMDDIGALYEAQEGRCKWCGKALNGKFHTDHIYPLARGGSNWPDNLALTCQFCNLSKGPKMPYEWRKLLSAPQNGLIMSSLGSSSMVNL